MPTARRGRAGSRFPFYFGALATLLLGILYHPGLIGLWDLPGLFDGIESSWQDGLHRGYAGRLPAADPRIVVAAIDDDAIRELGWPFTRDVHARLLDRLVALGAKAVAFDSLFLDPDKRDPDGDRRLVAATRRSGRTVHLALVQVEQAARGGAIARYRLPLPGLAEASRELGYPNVQSVIDSDGHIRRMEIFSSGLPYVRDRTLPFPSLDAAAASVLSGRPLRELAGAFPRPWVLYLRFRPPVAWLRHPYEAARRGRVLNPDTVQSAYRPVSVADILRGTLTLKQREAIRGGLVLVGSTVLGLYDHFPSPFSEHQPGVEFHANTIDNILRGDFARPAPRWVILLVITGMIWLPVLVRRLPPLASTAAAGAAAAGWFAFTSWQFVHGARWDFTAPMAALGLSFLVFTVHQTLAEEAEKRRIQRTFGQFVAPQVVEDLVRNPGGIRLGGEKRDMTVFFLDIAHFTSISEKMDPEALISFLNRYLSSLSRVVHERKGVVDKYIGDCVMAFWNAPIEQPAHRALACLAAVECGEAVEELNKSLDAQVPERPAIRIGLNSGVMTVGFTGSDQKLQYTVIGDEVNLGSRLEGANKFFGSRIMASEACYQGARDAVEARELGRLRVVGKEVPIRVYELLGRKGRLSGGWERGLPAYERGLALFNARDFAAAKACFSEVQAALPGDAPSRLYLSFCEDYASIPPPPDWDGVFNLTAK